MLSLQKQGGVIMNKFKYFVGIDVSKNSFSLAVKDTDFVIENKFFHMEKEGFNSLDKLLSQFKHSCIIGMESTGIYHTNLFYFLKNKGYNTVVINPYKMKQFFKFISDKPTKTDRKDAKAISEFMEISGDGNILSEQEKYQLRYIVREKENIIHQIAKVKTDIKRLLVLLFPEIEKYNVFTSSILNILLHFPSASAIRNISEKQFIKKCEKLTKNNGRKSTLTPEKIYHFASNSIAYQYPVYEKLLIMKIKSLLSLQDQLKNIKILINQIADNLFKREIQILTSIPGIGKTAAIHFISEIVDIKRFKNVSKLVGFCGLDTVIKQSGNYQGKWKISKRGNSHARRIVFIMASCVKRSCPQFREYYLKKRNEGKSYTEAVIATSTKLLRTIFALLNENRLFI